MKKVVLLVFVLVFLSIAITGRFISSVEASGTIYIMADGSITPSSAKIVTYDNITYTLTGNISDPIIVERDNIILNGANYTLQTSVDAPAIHLLGRKNVTLEYLEIKVFKDGVSLEDCSNCTLFRNIIMYAGNGTVPTAPSMFGIILNNCSNTRVYENRIKLSVLATPEWGGTGIVVFLFSTHNTISQNIIENTFEGISLQDTSSNHVDRNIIRNNYYGIGMADSETSGTITINNTISENNITSGLTGISLERCSKNTLFANNITENSHRGIVLYPEAMNNVVYKNYVANSGRGITLWLASNNSIYGNSFVNNSQQVYIIESPGYNRWDNGYPSGGNYWSDYNGTDFYSGPYQNVSGSDGIGDKPYVMYDWHGAVNSENRDNYPLVPPEKMLGFMIEKYEELFSDYQSLNSTYNDLKSKPEATVSELNYIRNLTYIFAATTIIFIATTVYPALRKPKVKSEAKTT